MNHSFPWLFPDSFKIPWLFPDFLTFSQNSLTFPWLEKVVSFFQVFQVFQCRWEPCNTHRILFIWLLSDKKGAARALPRDQNNSWYLISTKSYNKTSGYIIRRTESVLPHSKYIQLCQQIILNKVIWDPIS